MKKKHIVSNIERVQLQILLANSIGFFDTFAYSPELQTYYSDVDNSGVLQNDSIHMIALSRLVYGLAFSSSCFFPENLGKAQKAADFLLEHLIGEDRFGKIFIPSYSPEKGQIQPDERNIWEQSYGLCGLAELYRVGKDRALLEQIHSLFDAFIARFKDAEAPGFFFNYSLEKGPESSSKLLQSTMYPASAFMANLWEADLEHRDKYEPYLREIAALAYDKLWNEEYGWVNLQFNRDWDLCGKPGNTAPSCFNVNPGHNFQLAWFMLRMRDWSFLDEATREKYVARGAEIVNTTMQKDIWDGGVRGGFYEEVNPIDNRITSRRKCWWQHAEALIALSFLKEEYSAELYALLEYFLNTFSDFEIGGEFFYVEADNTPVQSEWKGNLGKSAYHVSEMVRYLLQAE